MKFYSYLEKKRTVRALLFLFAIGISNIGWAQMTVTGTVSDAETKETLIGASVVVPNTLLGTVTDFDGNFSLEVPEGTKTLTVSYIGYGKKDVSIEGKSNIQVNLSPGEQLEEVVVVGYGIVKKKDLTGSVSQVNKDDFNRGVIASPEQLLEGRATGVQVTANSGAPGAAAEINIRGASSIRAGNEPLIVIDGIQLDNRSVKAGGDVAGLGRSPAGNPFSFIDPNEIASIEVLKDASATAIYGSRGANGVIIITTKRGREGAPILEYSTQQGVSMVLNKPDYLSASEYRSALSTEGLGSANDLGDDVDAFDEITQVGYTNIHSLNVSGGNAIANYRVFGSFFDQEGVIINSGLRKINGGISSQFKFWDEDRLTIDVGVNASNLIEDGASVSDDAGFEGSLIGAALQWNPTKPLMQADTFNQDVIELRNPLAMSEYINDRFDQTRILANVGVTVKLIEGLSYKFTGNLDQARGERRVSADPRLNFADIINRGQAIVGNEQLGSVQFSNTLTYQKDVTDDFSINILAGHEYLKYTNKGTLIFATDLAQDVDLDLTNILASATNANQRVESFREPDVELRSFFGRGIFNWADKYLLTATIRADQSSKFGENNQTGVFPSFAAAWNIHEEDFLPDAFKRLKLRLGWGVTGNQEFPAGAAQEYFTYENGNLTQRNNPNPDLMWEQSIQYNAGIDFAFFDYRLTGTIDYFNKKTDDLILFVTLPQPNPSAEGRIYRNVDGTIKNSGLELGLNGTLITNDKLSWGLGVNFTYLANEVQDFGSVINTGAISGQGLTGAFAQRIENGQSLFAYYLPVWEGFDDEGISIYQDPVNGGTTRIGTVPAVKQFVGDPLPDVLLGIATDLTVGNFDLVANLSGQFGYQVYNNTANAVFVKGNVANGRNITSELVGNGESTTNSYPASTRYLEDGDHLRFSNLTIGYTFNNLATKWLKGLRISLTGQNLFVISGYSGFDPVVNTNKEIEGIPSFGIEYTPYPPNRSFLLGINLKI